jgi:hypothetical protein
LLWKGYAALKIQRQEQRDRETRRAVGKEKAESRADETVLRRPGKAHVRSVAEELFSKKLLTVVLRVREGDPE